MSQRTSPLSPERANALGAHVAEAEHQLRGVLVRASLLGDKTASVAVREALERLEIVRLECYWEPTNGRCTTCTQMANDPYRRRGENGLVTEGCVDEIHGAHVTGADALWHNRPEAIKVREGMAAHRARVLGTEAATQFMRDHLTVAMIGPK